MRSAYPIYVKLYSQNIPQNNLKWLITQILLSNISKRKLHQKNLQIEEFLYGGGGTYPNIKILIRGVWSHLKILINVILSIFLNTVLVNGERGKS